jgi:hypothetical protein
VFYFLILLNVILTSSAGTSTAVDKSSLSPHFHACGLFRRSNSSSNFLLRVSAAFCAFSFALPIRHLCGVSSSGFHKRIDLSLYSFPLLSVVSLFFSASIPCRDILNASARFWISSKSLFIFLCFFSVADIRPVFGRPLGFGVLAQPLFLELF